MTQTESHNNLFVALQAEMQRVDSLRLKLDFRQADQVLTEFLLRRLILHSQHAMHTRDNVKAERFWKALFQIGRSGNERPR